MAKYILLSEKSWHKTLFKNFKKKMCDDEWLLIDSKKEFNLETLNNFKPSKIFIPHWSNIISREIFENYECIVFHMTDLPFGRGGSPLQNLIASGHKNTKISAIKVEEGIDTGDIYLKRNLDLDGSAIEIFERASLVIEDMILEILQKNITPIPQLGEVVEFKRRKPEDGDLCLIEDLDRVYDYIRMLDCEGYPRAFLKVNDIIYEFENAKFDSVNKIITANVQIFKK